MPAGSEAIEVVNNVGTELLDDGFAADRGYLQPDDGQFDTATDVFAWCGGGVLLRRAYLDDIGLFDEDLFMYYEDIELAWRGAQRGWRYRYVPGSVVAPRPRGRERPRLGAQAVLRRAQPPARAGTPRHIDRCDRRGRAFAARDRVVRTSRRRGPAAAPPTGAARRRDPSVLHVRGVRPPAAGRDLEARPHPELGKALADAPVPVRVGNAPFPRLFHAWLGTG